MAKEFVNEEDKKGHHIDIANTWALLGHYFGNTIVPYAIKRQMKMPIEIINVNTTSNIAIPYFIKDIYIFGNVIKVIIERAPITVIGTNI